MRARATRDEAGDDRGDGGDERVRRRCERTDAHFHAGGELQAQDVESTTETVNGGNAHTSIDTALDYGNSVAHIIAELRTFTSSADDWDKMDTDYDSMSKTWVEDAVANYATTSNEWTWISTKVLRGINGVTAVANPLEAYIAEAVVIAKAERWNQARGDARNHRKDRLGRRRLSRLAVGVGGGARRRGCRPCARVALKATL